MPTVGLMEKRRAASAPRIQSVRPLKGLRVLVVDDNDDALDLMATLVRGFGATVVEASSVAAAIAALKKDNFSVLISDIAMPEQDGYDLIRWLRSADAPLAARAMPAVAVTASGTAADRSRALAAGFAEHVPKPVEVKALVGIVARLGTPRA